MTSRPQIASTAIRPLPCQSSARSQGRNRSSSASIAASVPCASAAGPSPPRLSSVAHSACRWRRPSAAQLP